jgi:uncharacterized protein (TIGR02172 family)
MTIELTGRIDSENAARIEQNIMAQLASSGESAVVLDAAGLEYISSAGLRTILHVRKAYPELRIVNVSSGVYDILEMTGFTTMMPVEKAYRTVSIEGCEEIGRGANGIIYRIDRDTVVKVYQDMNALSEIQHEREVAKLALILGIPTAISYDVVKVGDSYGSVFELLNARSFSKILAAEPEKLDWCVGEYVSLLKKIHSTLVPEGRLPDIRDTALEWAQGITDCLPDAAGKKLLALVKAVPYNDHMIHGDYHTKNVELQGDEVLIIDMDTLSVGHPVFELASMYNAFIGYSEMDRDCVKRFQGYDLETARTFWDKSLKAYLGTDNPGKLREVEDKARIVGYSRMIRRAIRHGGLETDTGRQEIDLWKERLLALLETTDTLVFDPDELELDAEVENLGEVQAFVDARLEAVDCPVKTQMQIDLAVEEIFVNIASYAYDPGKGKATVRVKTVEDPPSVTITFLDRGMPYDPLKREDPNTSLPAEERDMGGLGIYMTKKIMDQMIYAYEDGQNILTLKKNL